MMWRLVVLFGAFVVVTGQSTPVSQCTGHEGDLPISTYIEGCTSIPCRLPQLQDALFHFIFKAPRASATLHSLGTAYWPLGSINIPIPYGLGDNALTCNFLFGPECPVQKDDVMEYTLSIGVESFFPVGVELDIEIRVVDENQSPFFCIRVPVRIEPPVSKT